MKRNLLDRAAWAVAGALAVAVIASYAGVVRGGPLDPPLPPGSTSPLVEPRTPISASGFAISQPGSYYLTRDITASPGQFGITVIVSDVTIDLNGFTLRGVVGAFDAIDLGFQNRNITVRNGAVAAWPGVAIKGASAIGARYERLTIRSNTGGGIVAGADSMISDCVVSGNGGNGIAVAQSFTSGSGIVSGCIVDGNMLDGVLFDNNMTVSGNTITNNGADGIHATDGGNRIDGNNLNGNIGKEINVEGSGNTIVRNSFGGADSDLSIVVGNSKGPTENGGTPLSNPWANIAY